MVVVVGAGVYRNGPISAYNQVPIVLSNVLSNMSTLSCCTGLRAESPIF